MKNKRMAFQIAMYILCVILGVSLVALVFVDRRNNAKRIIEAQIQREELEKEEQEKLDQAINVYNELIANLNLRNIVCWGDNEMAGSQKLSLPPFISELTNDNLTTLLRNSFSRVMRQDNLEVPSISVTNMGVSNEGMNEILVRAGINEIEVGEWALIPGATDPVNLVLRDSRSSSTLYFAHQRENSFGQVYIDNIKGTLVEGEGSYDNKHPRFAFVREEGGSSEQVSEGAEIEIESGSKYLGDIPIFFFEDDTADTTNDFVSDIEELVERYSESDGIYVMICTVEEGSDLDGELTDVFGSHYIRNDTSAGAMTKETYSELAQKVYDNLDKQGCFTEIEEKVEKAAKEIK